MSDSTAPAAPHRLTVIATRTGDDGTTGLGDGTRVAKSSPRIEALGAVDELNSQLGLLRCEALPAAVDAVLDAVQHDLFDLGAELAVPGHAALALERVAALDHALAHHNATLTPLREFILPGGCRAAALAHVCRAQCRRAERAVLIVHATEPIPQAARLYLNRLSDLLFVLARCLNQAVGRPDVYWRGRS